MSDLALQSLYDWCVISYTQLENHPQRKVPFQLAKDAAEMAEIMARTLVDEIKEHNDNHAVTRAIVPCGPTGWYKPFTRIVNEEKVSLNNLVVFHMDECLDWQGKLLPKKHPCNFRTYMERHFYGGIAPDLAVPVHQRHFPTPRNMEDIAAAIREAPVDITLGGWGQDGHIAYNQARRHPFIKITLEELRQSGIRIQENNIDTVIAWAQRNFGTAYQFVPSMSVTLGIKECLSAKKVRVFSDTGAWKQTALRIALLGPLTAEYPMTLLQEHPDALITATVETAKHPFSENPEWDFFGDSGYYPS
jgi:glucosamine-6-phosphate deaminase